MPVIALVVEKMAKTAVRRHFGRLIETTLAGRAFVDIAMTVRDHRDHTGDARV